ncbi:hypothetical protein C0991_011175 [Blastosporella zonata]|nr:hypothetical protein C0991_011175 [Blastosporella zonata]
MAPIFSQGLKKTPSQPHISHFTPTNKRTLIGDYTPARPPQKRSKIAHLEAAAPLAEKLRPNALSDFVGQPHLIGPDSLLMKTLEGASAGSMIFWGPPGCGKTTLARLITKQADCVFKELSATVVGVNDVRATLEEAKRTLALTGR